jgi:hypothetical protein
MRWLIASLLFMSAPVAAQAAAQANIGTLTCTIAKAGETGETPPSETRAMLCVFKPEGAGPEERYQGEIQKVGTSSALDKSPVLIWIVTGPGSKELTPGLLAQTYVGELSPGTGGAARTAPALIGKENEAYALRPMGTKGSEGPEGSVTVLVLKAATIPA